MEWAIVDFLKEMLPRTSVEVEGRTIHLRAWRYEVKGISGFKIPIYFLDTDLQENAEWDRRLTDFLYGGDQHYRLCQEGVLGKGGVKMLRALGYDRIGRFHMNEEHSSLLTLEFLDEEAKKAGRESFSAEDIEAVREKCVFTTHTPVPAGHDQFPLDLVSRVLRRQDIFSDKRNVFCCEGLLNMTYLALNLSRYVNGVAKKHGEVSRLMFAGYQIEAITNGVHATTWVAEPFVKLYDQYIPGWKQDHFSLRYALSIPLREMWDAHLQAKKHLIQQVNEETKVGMDVEVFTLGFARRSTAYKRGDLFFTDMDRLRSISSKMGPFQMIYGGKAHPHDQGGKELIRRIFQAKAQLDPHVKIAYLENYDMKLGKMITSGVDLWLNTPQPPMEASGTSGMKAALNGVPSLSVLDGWWIEGHLEGVTGWSIGGDHEDPLRDAASLYDQLEQVVLPLFYHDRNRFIEVMRNSVAINGSFFNTHRMMQEYVLNAYFR